MADLGCNEISTFQAEARIDEKDLCNLQQLEEGATSDEKEKKFQGDMQVKSSSSSVDDLRFNEKMRELMEKKFSSSVHDMSFCDEMVHVMDHKLYEAASDKNAGAEDRFLNILEQVCTKKKVDLATIFNHVTPSGDSVLHVAAQHGSEQVVRLIAFHYPKILSKTNMKGDTPLHVAARATSFLPIWNIFMTSMEATSMVKGKFIMSKNNYGRTALHEAVLCKNYAAVRSLVREHEQSDLTSYWTWNYDCGCKSPMYLAVLTRDVDILGHLLNKIPIPLGKAISNGDSPLHAAMSEGNKDLLKMIVKTRKELLYQRDENNNTPLHHAAYNGYMEGVCIMLETSPTIAFQRNSDGNLPIHLACEKGKVEVVKKLLKIEWPNVGLFLNNEGQNILHLAAMKGQTRVIKHLLKHPKIHHDTVNERDVNGDTPLHLASRELRLWTLLLLSQDKMVDVNLVNNNGLTARDVVKMQRRNPMTYQEVLANVILYNVGVPRNANRLSAPPKRSINKEWNVKGAANTLILVAILIATVTFTAGFTIPGGFYSSDGPIAKERGMALLADKTLFKIFMAFNTIAMYSSTVGSIILLRVPIGDFRMSKLAFKQALTFVYVALIAMPIAFLAAIRLVVSNNTIVADVISVIGFIFIFLMTFIGMLKVCLLKTCCPVLRQIVGLVVRILVVLCYGYNDTWSRGQVSRVNKSIKMMPKIKSNEAFAT